MSRQSANVPDREEKQSAEDEPKKPGWITVRLHRDRVDRMRDYAEQNGRKIAAVFDRAIDLFFELEAPQEYRRSRRRRRTPVSDPPD